MSEINRKYLRKILTSVFLLIAGGIILYWLLHDTENAGKLVASIKKTVTPFLTGAAFAFVINVPMRAIEGRLIRLKNETLRRVIALVVTFILVLLVLTVVFLLLIPQLIATVESLIPTLYDFVVGMEERINTFLSNNPELMEWVAANTDFENLDILGLAQKALSMAGNSISTILSGAFSAIGSIAGAIVNLVIAVVFAIYCLFQKETLARQGRKLLYAFLPENIADQVVRIMRLSNSTFSNFLSGQCVEVCILGAMFAVAMAIFKMPYIPLVSVLVAVTAFIPIVGAFIGCIFGAFFIFVDNPVMAFWFVIMFLIIQQIEGNVIYPRVVGTSIGLSGMWVLVAVSVGGTFMGVAGMFLMIPFASVLHTLLRELTHNRLDDREIDPQKLKAHEPELRSHFKEKRKSMKKAKQEKKKTQKEVADKED